MSKETVFGLINKLEDWLRGGLEIIEDFRKTLEETPEEIIASPSTDFLSKGDKIYARLLKSDSQLQILPVESLGIKADDPAIRWLERHPFRKIAEKHGLKVVFEQKDRVLEKIKVEGKIDEEIMKDLLDPALWALEKAANRA